MTFSSNPTTRRRDFGRSARRSAAFLLALLLFCSPLAHIPALAAQADGAENNETFDFVQGDVYGDGKINARDVIALMNMVITGESPSKDVRTFDLNGDEKINARDVISLMIYIISVSPNHTHNYAFLNEVPADCVISGVIILKCDCGFAYFVDTEKIPEDHEHKFDYVYELKPTCTEEGVAYLRCIYCGAFKDGDESPRFVNPLDHNWSEWKVAKQATCLDDGTEKRTCLNCNKAETKTIPKTGHDWGAWVTVKEATTTETGVRRRVCLNDKNHTEEKVIPKINNECVHEFDFVFEIEPTCTEEGVAYLRCIYCGIFENGYESPWSADALGHKYGEWETVTKQTCYEVGKRERICIRCGKAETETIPCHTYGDWSIIKQPTTCLADGTKQRICTICRASETAIIPKGGHDWNEWVIIKEATTTESGSKRRVCKNDKSHIEERIIPKLCEGDYVPTWQEQYMLDLINDARAEAGVEPLAFASKYYGYAKTRVSELPVLYGHTRPDGTKYCTVIPGVRDEWSLPSNLKTVGENLAVRHVSIVFGDSFNNETNVKALFNNLMNS